MTHFFFFINFVAIFTISLYFLSNVMINKSNDFEKLTAYECGFNPFNVVQTQFNVKFYITAILFIVFDLEIMYLFPWVLSIKQIGFFGFFIMFIFLLILTIGFIYEWINGALDWELLKFFKK